MKSILRRAGIGLAIAACFSVAALAAPSEQTRIDVRTRYGTVETVVLQDFAAGEVRSLSTAAGNPALATRTAAGVKLELAGETFDIALPDPEHAEAEAGGAGRKVIRIEKHEKAVADGEHTEKKTLIVRHSGGEGELDEASALALAEGAEPGPLAEGQRIRVIRQIRREAQQVER